MPLLPTHTKAVKASKTTSKAPVVEIALLNNLSDAGLERGDRQIVDIFREVSGPRTVRLHFFSLPSIVRGPAGRAYVDAHYADFDKLKTLKLDGLIVTGCEPRCSRLSDEAFWPELADVIDWAEHNTRSTIWSCLAAHAAVLHLDGIERRPLATKCTGLFEVEQIGSHPLFDNALLPLSVPHSRWNGLDFDRLTAAGYNILTHNPEVGADTFVKQWRSLFVFLQGHPEYDADALRREYRRDVLRFLEGISEAYPSLPRNYFDPETETKLRAFESFVWARRDPRLALSLPLSRRGAPMPQAFAKSFFGNWLGLLQTKSANHAA